MNDNIPNQLIFAKAIADSTRQRIMELCCCDWKNVTEIVESVGVSQPTVSHHMALLREANLVKVKTEGKHTYYTLNQENFALCCGQLLINFAPDTNTTAQVKKV